MKGHKGALFSDLVFLCISTVSVLAALGRFFFALCQFVGTGFLFCSPILEECSNLRRPKGAQISAPFAPRIGGSIQIWIALKIKGIEGDEISSPFAVNDKHRQIGGIEYPRNLGERVREI